MSDFYMKSDIWCGQPVLNTPISFAKQALCANTPRPFQRGGFTRMSWTQYSVTLRPRPRGFHLVTSEIMTQLPELATFKVGLVHIFIQHTSASLALNENADPEVRVDMESYFNRLAPENEPYYTHTYEGSDDMPAHLKSVILGSSVTVPITDGRLNLGTWQGIYLCEHRDRGGARRLVITIQGEG